MILSGGNTNLRKYVGIYESIGFTGQSVTTGKSNTARATGLTFDIDTCIYIYIYRERERETQRERERERGRTYKVYKYIYTLVCVYIFLRF